MPGGISGVTRGKLYERHTRNPLFVFRFVGLFLFRYVHRVLSRSLFQEPPRNTRNLCVPPLHNKGYHQGGP